MRQFWDGRWFDEQRDPAGPASEDVATAKSPEGLDQQDVEAAPAAAAARGTT